MTLRRWLRQNLNLQSQERDTNTSSEALLACPSCGSPISQTITSGGEISHNSETCRLVNLVLAELGISFGSFGQMIRVEIYPGAGPLRGFYFTADPYTIHISEGAYADYREYIIFHETKHLVDCLTRGHSEEVTPDQFARYLCTKYGYRIPADNPGPGISYA